MSIGVSAFAAGTGSITITPPSGLQADDENTYNIYKVFDADGDGTNISYKIISGKGTSIVATDNLSKFEADSAGNVRYYERTSTEAEWVINTTQTQLSAGMIEAIAVYVGSDEAVATATSTGTNAATASGLPNGYYYITTSTGTVVTIDSTNPNANVQDKNTIPTVDKTITGASDITDSGKKALAQIGTDVEYTAVVTVGKGSKNLVFHDKMDDGLTFKGNSNVTVSVTPPTGGSAPTGTWYTIKATPDSGDTLTISFVDGIAEGTVITIVYKATINANALTKLENDAKVTYGDGYTTTESKTEVYNAEINVIKYDGKNTEATTDDTNLTGAGFKIKNADNKWYKLEGTVVSWVDNQADGTEVTTAIKTVANPTFDSTAEESDTNPKTIEKAVASFTGLPNGAYTIVETTVPSGFNKAADQTITIASGNYTLANLSQSTDVLNNQGTVLPSTGGIGTTIFYVVGSILVVAAGVLLITKKRMSREG